MVQRSSTLGFNFGACLLLLGTVLTNVVLNTDFKAAPRFDGAGYAILAEALATGRGYREISGPNAARHDHFPPGYPVVLAGIWWFAGRSVIAAHAVSATCTVAAVLLAWTWLRAIYPKKLALLLGMAVAFNWSWGRIGGSIQSEPLFMAVEQLAVVMAVLAQCHGGVSAGIKLGIVLGVAVLIRHVGICLCVAVLLNFALCRHWKELLASALTIAIVIFPWMSWLILVRRHSQISLLVQDGLYVQLVRQTWFYFQRLPDQVIGPFVEVATAGRSPSYFAVLASFWALVATSTLVYGWTSMLQVCRCRLASMIGFLTLGLLLIWPFSEAGRFLIPLLPFILLGLTEGLARLLKQVPLRQSRYYAAVLITGISIPYSMYAIVCHRAQAQRERHSDFDAACRWILNSAKRSGPVLARHPGEVFWQTGRLAVEPDASDPDSIDHLIAHLGVTYILIDEERYLSQGLNILRQYVERFPNRVRLVWGTRHAHTGVEVFEITR